MWVTPNFFHHGKNVYQKTICLKVQCRQSGEILKVLKSETVNTELYSLFIIYAKTSLLVDDLKSC